MANNMLPDKVINGELTQNAANTGLPAADTVETIICLGSNAADAGKFITSAIAQLSRLGSIRVSGIYPSEGGYSNCVASLITGLPLTALVAQAKQIEALLGRRTGDKERGSVPIDIDVVIYDHTTVKAADAEKNYFTTGLELLKNVNSIPGQEKIL